MMIPAIRHIRIFISYDTHVSGFQAGDAPCNPHLPPHLLPDTVGTATESLCRNCEVVGLVLKSVETLATLRNLVDVVPHHADGVVDLL